MWNNNNLLRRIFFKAELKTLNKYTYIKLLMIIIWNIRKMLLNLILLSKFWRIITDKNL